MTEKFGGKYDMSHIANEFSAKAVRIGSLGPGNLGSFGPNSDEEARAAENYGHEKYIRPATLESYCMDDRFEGHGIQLPGNRAITEIAGLYMGSGSRDLLLSEAVAMKVKELVSLGNKPVFHGDETTGRAGCAANVNMRAVLAYNADHVDMMAELSYERLRLLGIDTIDLDRLKTVILTGGDRAARDGLWDVTAEEVVEIAQQNGASYIEFKGAHHTAGPNELFTDDAFDNGAFRAEHTTDDGHPLGALVITYRSYLNQVSATFSREESEKKAMHCTLFGPGILKLACKDEAVDVIVA